MTIAIRTAFCYSVAELYKLTTWNKRLIPLLCGAIGLVLGVLGFYFVPLFPAEDLLQAVTLGLASGLAATGAYEAIKE